tara:strand:- start:1328 stop:1528 length:201 start_codon:yes stop_codon:yes gene_type:complete
MMVKVEREDIKGSFQTILRLIDGDEAQEILVYVWEADIIIEKLKTMPLTIVNSLKNKTGKVIVKEW